MQKKDLKIENSIYKEKYIKSAIKDFVGFEIKYINGILSISASDLGEIELIFNEFMNYVLGLQNQDI